MLYDDLTNFLLSQSSLTDLVSTNIFTQTAELEVSYPAIVVQITDVDPLFFVGSSTNLAKVIVRFHVHAYTPEETHTISQVLIALLHNFRGTMGENEHEVKVIFEGLLDPDPDDIEETYVYHRWLHFMFRCDLLIV